MKSLFPFVDSLENNPRFVRVLLTQNIKTIESIFSKISIDENIKKEIITCVKEYKQQDAQVTSLVEYFELYAYEQLIANCSNIEKLIQQIYSIQSLIYNNKDLIYLINSASYTVCNLVEQKKIEIENDSNLNNIWNIIYTQAQLNTQGHSNEQPLPETKLFFYRLILKPINSNIISGLEKLLQLAHKQNGQETIRLQLPIQVTKKTITNLSNTLSKLFSSSTLDALNTTINPSLIGGFKAQQGSYIIDESISTKIKNLQKKA